MSTVDVIARPDFIYYVYGASFFVMAAFAAALQRERRHSLPWRWLQVFGISHGSLEWLEMVVPTLSDSPAFAWARLAILLVSFLALFEFGRAARRAQVPQARWCQGWLYVPLLGLVGFGLARGPAELEIAIRYGVAFPAALLVATAFWQAAQRAEPGATALRVASFFSGAYAILSGLIPSSAVLFPASIINTRSVLEASGLPVPLLRSLAVAGVATALWRVVIAVFAREGGALTRTIPLRIRGTALGLLLIAVATWAGTEELGAYAERMFQRNLLTHGRAAAAAVDRTSPLAATPLPIEETSRRVTSTPGMDFDPDAHRHFVSRHRLIALGFGVLLTLLLLDFFGRHHRLWVNTLHLAESERRLRSLSTELEQRVDARTAELASANEALVREIEQHRRAELKYRTLTDQLPAITYTVTLGAHPPTTFISPQVKPLLGVSAEQWLTDPDLWVQLIHPEDRNRVLAAMRHGETTGEPFDADYRLMGPDGRILWFHNSARYVRGPDGRTQFAHGVMLDITDRVRSEQALIETSERYRLLFERSPVGVFHYDQHLRVTECNERFATIIQSSKQRVLGFDLANVRDPSVLPALRAAALEGREGSYEGLYRATTSEAQVWIALRTAPLMGARGEILGGVGIVEDLTERRRLDEERIKTQKLESLGLLAGGIAHDFNNILTAILGNISMARLSQTITDRDTLEMLAEAEQASLRAKDLTQQLLTFAKGGAPVKKAANVGELIRDAAAFTVRGSASQLQYQITRELWTAEVDPGQIGQVVQNLVLNADQAMPRGGTISIAADNVQLRAEDVPPLPAGAYLRVSVRDTGLGIPEEYLSQIFDPYFTTKHKGSGLGLTTTFSIVRKHGGHITVTSRVGEGSRFTFYLPALPTSASAMSATGATERPLPGHGRVLVMDDEAPILALACKMLERAGYEVETASDGEAALSAYAAALERAQPFAAVILDLTVPGGLGGKETFQRLRELDPAVRAIVSSGYSTDRIMAQFAEMGFAGVVPKPYTANELRAALRHALDGTSEPAASA